MPEEMEVSRERYKVTGKSITRLWFQSLFGLFIAFEFFWIFNSLFLGLLTAAFLFFIPFYKEKDITNRFIFAILMIIALYMAFNLPGTAGLGLDLEGSLFAPWTWNTTSIIFVALWIISMLVGLTTSVSDRRTMGVIMILISFVIFATGPGLQEAGSAFFGQWWPTVYTTATEVFGPLGEFFSGILNTLGTGMRMVTNPQEFAQEIVSGVYARDPETGLAGAYGVEIESLRTTPLYPEQPFNVIMKLSNKGAYPAKRVRASISLGEAAPTQTEGIKTEMFRSLTERVKSKVTAYLEKGGTTKFESVLIDLIQDREKGIESFSRYVEELKDDLVDKATKALNDFRDALKELDRTKVEDYVNKKMHSVKTDLEGIGEEVRKKYPEIDMIIDSLDKTKFTSTDVKNVLNDLKELSKKDLPQDTKTVIESAIRTVRLCKIINWLDSAKVENLVDDVKSKLGGVKGVSLKKGVNLDEYVENVRIYGKELENHLEKVEESTAVLYDELELKFIAEELPSDIKDIVYPPGILKTPFETLELVKTVAWEIAWEVLTIGGTLKSVVHEIKTILRIPVPWTKDIEGKISEMKADVDAALTLARRVEQKAVGIGDKTLQSNSKKIVEKLEAIEKVLSSKKIENRLEEIRLLRSDIEGLKNEIRNLKDERSKLREELEKEEDKDRLASLMKEIGNIDTRIEAIRETIATKITQIKELIDGSDEYPHSGINDIIDREVSDKINGKGDDDIMGYIGKMKRRLEGLEDEWVRRRKDITLLVDLEKDVNEVKDKVGKINEGVLSTLVTQTKKAVSSLAGKVKSLTEKITDPAKTLWEKMKTNINKAYEDIKDDSLLDMAKKVDKIVDKIGDFVDNVNLKLESIGINITGLLDKVTPDMIDELGFEEKGNYTCWSDECYQEIEEMPKSDIRQLIFESKGIPCSSVKAFDLREKFIPFNGTVEYEYEIDSQLKIEVISDNEWKRLARENRLYTQMKRPSTFNNAPVKLNIDTLEQPLREGTRFHIALQLVPAEKKNSEIKEPVVVRLDVPHEFGDGICTPAPNPEEGEGKYVWHGYHEIIICNFNGIRIGDVPSKTFVVKAHASYVFSKSKTAVTKLEFGGIRCE